MKYEESNIRYYMLEIRQSIGSGFLLAVLMGIVCIGLDCGFDFAFLSTSYAGGSTVYTYIGGYFPNNFYGAFVFAPLMALPYGLSYCRDYKAGFLRQIVMRTGIFTYCKGKIIATFVSSFLAGGISITICVLLIHFFVPLADASDTAMSYEPFGYWIIAGKYCIYFIVFVFLMSLWCAVYGIAVLCISSYCKNTYVSIAVGVTGNYAWTVIQNVVGWNALYRPKSWFSCWLTPFSNQMTFIICLTGTVVITAVSTGIFYRKVKMCIQRE